ncbi:MAG: cytochrome c1 [Alphaproteobacteria bacterium]|nr:cytochrome c1 [Alphaproteobacteria bacterium]HPF47880.1 cytochrome c1 [Emcibacteraceae bacterium]
MLKNIKIKGLLAGLVGATIAFSGATAAESTAKHPERHHYESAGIFGKFDIPSIQRGLQVYREVCSACHSLNLVAFRTLGDIGYNEDEIKAIAAEYDIDTIDETGEVTSRPGIPADYFPSPYANEQAARASNNGALPPDFSTIVKAREHLAFMPWSSVYGEDYVIALMTGYHDEPPAGFDLLDGLFYNDAFEGNQIAMTPPLSDGIIEYADGTETTVEQMSYDVANFLAWVSDPTMQQRKEMGLKVMLFMFVFVVMLYFTNKRVWKKVKKGEDIDPSEV